LISRTSSSIWQRRTAEHWARIGIGVQLVILIRTLAEFYRLRHYYGAAEALVRYQPYIGGLLINSILCAVTVVLLFWRKQRAAALTAALTILVLLAYKVIVIGPVQ
jgi:hypothetical protein